MMNDSGRSPETGLPARLKNRYELRERLGDGGMGVVHRATDLQLRRDVAIKILKEDSAQGRARFAREATAAAKLTHPNIVSVYDVGEDAGSTYIVMELLTGGTLDALIRKRAPARSLVELIEKVARAVQFAHDGGLVHRDLKPQNVLIAGDGTPKVADFGLARLVDASDRVTQTGVVMGTPHYMAPEQLEGAVELDARTDVYALGAILYEALTARPPHAGRTMAELFHRILSDEPAAPRAIDPRVAPEIEAITLRALEKEPSRRYSTAGEFADDLRRWLAGEAVFARPPSAGRRFVRWTGRHRVVVAASAIVLCAAAAAVVVVPRWRAAESKVVATEGRLEEARLFLGIEKDLDVLRMKFYQRDFRLGDPDFAEYEALVARIRSHMARSAESATGHSLVGRCLEVVGEFDEADRAYRRALELQPDHAATLVAAGRLRLECALQKRAYRGCTRARAAQLEREARAAVDGMNRASAGGMERDLAERYWELIRKWDDPAVMPAAPMLDKWRGRPFVEEFLLLEALSRRGDDLKPSLDLLVELQQRMPAYGRAWYWGGLMRRDVDGKWADFTRALELNPRDLAARMDRAILAADRGDHAAAIEDYSRIIERAPDSAAAYVNRGRAYSAAGNLEAAFADMRRGGESDPRSPDAWHNLGLVRSKTGDLKGAVGDYTRAIEIDPQMCDYFVSRGVARQELGEYDEALADADRAVEIDPRDSNAYNNRGAVRLLREDVQGAREDIDRAIELDPASADTLINRASLQLQTGDPEKAAADIVRALELNPRLPEAHLCRGLLLLTRRDYAGARTSADRALALDPSLARAYLVRGSARGALGEVDGALDDVRKALELSPSLLEAYIARAGVRLAKGDADGAVSDCTHVLARKPRHIMAFALRGLAHAEKKDKAAARADYLKALELCPPGWYYGDTLREALEELDRPPRD